MSQHGSSGQRLELLFIQRESRPAAAEQEAGFIPAAGRMEAACFIVPTEINEQQLKGSERLGGQKNIRFLYRRLHCLKIDL